MQRRATGRPASALEADMDRLFSKKVTVFGPVSLGDSTEVVLNTVLKVKGCGVLVGLLCAVVVLYLIVTVVCCVDAVESKFAYRSQDAFISVALFTNNYLFYSLSFFLYFISRYTINSTSLYLTAVLYLYCTHRPPSRRHWRQCGT